MINFKKIFSYIKSPLNREIKIVRVFLLQVILLINIMFIIGLYFWIREEYNKLDKERTSLQKEYIESQKTFIKTETERAINYINYRIQYPDRKLKTILQNRVELAHNIATNIYEKNKNNTSTARIKSLIKDALRPMRFDTGRGYYFIGSLDGYQILFPVAPEHEDKYFYNLQDNLGNYVIQDELNVVKTKGEGFVTHYWTQPGLDTGMAMKKLSYVKLFEPLNWYIGTGDYYHEFNKTVQQEILEYLSHYRFGKEGYIFINTYDGDALLTNGEVVKKKMNLWELEDPNGIKVIQEERRAVKNPEGDFIYYSWRKLTSEEIGRKMSFVKGVPEWQWIVGTGVYLEEIDRVLDHKEKELKASLKKDILLVILTMSILLVLIYLLALYLTRKTAYNINSFIHFFKTASHENTFIDESKINFPEFKLLASSANKMITELKEAERKKQEEEAHYRKLFEESSEAIVFVDNKNKVQRINSAFTKLYGYEPSEVIHKDLDKIIVPPELQDQALKYSKQFHEGSYGPVEAIRLRKDNQKIHVSILGTPVIVDNQYVGFYVIYRDITDQKKFEQELYDSKTKAEESDRLKSSFLTNLSHEIRTPLNAIIGFSTLLNTKEISANDQKEYLKILANSGKLLLEIIDSIIDLSKIESSTLVINKVQSNLNTMLDELYLNYTEYNENMNHENIKLILNKEINNDGLYVFTDVKRVKQVFTNLIENAFKFTEKGSVEFGYTVEQGYIRCYVKDTGIGIKEDETLFIFDRFRQADESTTRKYGGTGIGLALCKSLVELLDGKLWVESKINEGSCFNFTFPHSGTKKVITHNPNQKSYDNVNWKSKKILIAEDVETNYRLLETFLSKTKANIEWAKDGKETVDMVEKNSDYDLILMDINMPIMNGHDALKTLIEKGVKIPVIAQTAYANDEEKYEILNLGYSDYILKPISFKALLQKLSKFLD